MPFLRVVRDKRGYETTYLMHWYREGHRQRPRILYIFRTPGGVRVGRDPLEPAVQRLIEAQYPDIAFDWRAVREHQQLVDTSMEPRRRRARRVDEEAPSGPTEAPALGVPPPAGDRPARLALPPSIQGTTPAEQAAFLAEWYPRIRDDIAQRPVEPTRQQALLALVERLNPATWVEPEAGVQQAAEALQRLSRVFVKRRRRARKRATDHPPPDTDGAPTET